MPGAILLRMTAMNTEVLPGHGLMSTLDRSGDHRIMWDRGNEDEVAAARRSFDDLLAKGYLAYEPTGKRGEQGSQVRRFDPEAERIILVKPLQGG